MESRGLGLLGTWVAPLEEDHGPVPKRRKAAVSRRKAAVSKPKATKTRRSFILGDLNVPIESINLLCASGTQESQPAIIEAGSNLPVLKTVRLSFTCALPLTTAVCTVTLEQLCPPLPTTPSMQSLSC
jgi:hypothetical protein